MKHLFCFITLTAGMTHLPVYFNTLTIRAIEPTISGSKVYTDVITIDVAESSQEVYSRINTCKE